MTIFPPSPMLIFSSATVILFRVSEKGIFLLLILLQYKIRADRQTLFTHHHINVKNYLFQVILL